MLMEPLPGQTGAGDTQVINKSMVYQTASDILNNISNKNDTEDIVILYENVESDTNGTLYAGSKPKPSNQYVETIVFNDDIESDWSDVSEIYTKEDFLELCMINNETIDLINNIPSIENRLCHKNSNIKLKSSEFTDRGNRRQFLTGNPGIDTRPTGFNIFGPTLPMTIVDYMYWKRPDEDYYFYIDNIISYVQYTIEQLKRISDGEYLSEKAKQKWRDTKIFEKKELELFKNTVLPDTISNPIQPHNNDKNSKTSKNIDTHSDINLKFSNKRLEKKIVLDIPKFIGGTFALLGKLCDNKLIIRCKDSKSKNHEVESQMILALDLKHPTLPLIYKNSKFTMQTFPNLRELCRSNLPSLDDNSTDVEIKPKLSIVELEDPDLQRNEIKQDSDEFKDMKSDSNDALEKDDKIDNSNLVSDKSKMNVENVTESFSIIKQQFSPDVNNTNTLSCALRRLNTRSPVYEETESNSKKKIKSPTRVRIKSPYENRSYVLDEKKRKRLLEIRERREKRKVVASKNCKIARNKYGQGSIFAQASTSVTKLSITNKSFYNSIYGHNIYTERKQSKRSPRNKINDSNLFKDTESYMENLEFNNSIASSYDDNLLTDCFKILQQYTKEDENINTDRSVKDVKFDAWSTSSRIAQEENVLPTNQNKPLHSKELDENKINMNQPQFIEKNVAANTKQNLRGTVSSKTSLSLECRKSIDKIYNLMNELAKPDNLDTKSLKSDSTSASVEILNVRECDGSMVSFGSLDDSNTRHKNTSPSFETRIESSSQKKGNNNVEDNNYVSKTSLTLKPQTSVKFDDQTNKIYRKNAAPKLITTNLISVNPLKAISQIIHRFENVQKQTSELKSNKKLEETSKEDKNNLIRLVSSKASKHDKLWKNNNQSKESSNRVLTPKEKKSSITKEQPQKVFNRFRLQEFNKNTEKNNDKNIEDLLDEVKEMRGEAVRGPKQTRLDALAQPKKLHLDPNKEYGVHYGRNFSGNKLQRKSQIPQKTYVPFQNNKLKKRIDIKSPHAQITNSKNQEDGVASRKPESPVKRYERTKVTHPKYSYNTSNLKKKSFVDDTKQFGQPLIHFKDFTKPRSPERRGSPKSRAPDDNPRNKTSPFKSSAIDSNSLGKKLHYTVNPVGNAAPPSSLTVVDEFDESHSFSYSELIECDKFEVSEEKSYDSMSVSDYPIDIFEDKCIETAVASTSHSQLGSTETILKNKESKQLVKYNKRSLSSLTAVQTLGNAWTGRHAADDTFSYKLIENLTPQRSMQQIFILQSGDSGSMLVKSTISSVQSFVKSIVDWSCDPIPVQCFPVIQSMQYCNPVHNLIKKKYYSTNNCGPRTLEIKPTENQKYLKINYDANKKPCIKKDKINDVENKAQGERAPKNIVDITVTEINEKVENMSNTTSMDILVGLLNEIKNISSCQSDLEYQHVEEKEREENIYKNHISITELDQLRKLHSNSSLYSYFNSSNELTNTWSENKLPTENMNEENVNFIANYVNKQFLSASTEDNVHSSIHVPSQPLPVFVDRSTSICPSAASECVGEEYGAPGRCVANCDKGCLASSSSASLNAIAKYAILDFNEQTNLQKLNKTDDQSVIFKEDLSKKKLIAEQKKFLQYIDVGNGGSNKEAIGSHLKVKRDILVTVYSILVLTVFAALTIPGF